MVSIVETKRHDHQHEKGSICSVDILQHITNFALLPGDILVAYSFDYPVHGEGGGGGAPGGATQGGGPLNHLRMKARPQTSHGPVRP